MSTVSSVARKAVAFYVISVLCASTARAADPYVNHYLSTGDSFWFGATLPIDSRESIAASFDMLKDVYGVQRIYWRGLQDTTLLDGPSRPENVGIASYTSWLEHLVNDVNINRIAVEEAHARGLELWGVASLYDWGVSPDDPVFLGWPGDAESVLRAGLPDRKPVDRYGHRRMGGSIELAYPDARQAMVEWTMNHVSVTGYDGVMLQTYAENFSQRFGDEFGFSDPIVNEFKDRYGVDIRREDFNRQDWYDLKGEYATQFLHELKAELELDNKQLGVAISPQNPALPQYWNGSPFPMAGNITIDWEAWANNNTVDTLMVWGGNSNAYNAAQQVLDGTDGTGVNVTFMTSSPYNPAHQPAVNRGAVPTGAMDTEVLYLAQSNIPTQPLSSLTSDNPYYRMKILQQVIDGQTAAAAADILPRVSDNNLLVRRMALTALATIGDASIIPVLEAALNDPENAIRNAAIYALQGLNRPQSVTAIFDSIKQHRNFQLIEGAIPALSQASNVAALLQGAQSDDALVRATAVRALKPFANSTHVNLLRSLLDDPDDAVRYYTVRTLANVPGSLGSTNALLAEVQRADPLTRSEAAAGLAYQVVAGELGAQIRYDDILETISDAYRSLGDGYTGTDAEWAYRPLGNALIDLGPDGQNALRQMMNQRTDRRLSEQAWQSLYIEQRLKEWETVTEEQDAYAHFKHPRWDTEIGIRDSFDTKAPGTFINGQKAEFGLSFNVPYGRIEDQIVQDQISVAGQALSLTRRFADNHLGHAVVVSGHRYETAAAELTAVRAKASWLRESDTDLVVFGFDTSSILAPTIYVGHDGFYRVWETDGTPNGGSYISTEYKAGSGGWETLEIFWSFNEAAEDGTLKGTFDVYLSRDAENALGALSRTLIASDIQAGSIMEQSLLSMVISNQSNGYTDVTTYWDNILFTVGMVPEPAGVTVLMAGYVMLAGRGPRQRKSHAI